eukprot:5321903-Amphidinium_carterae.1
MVQLSATTMSLPKVAGRVPLKWPLAPSVVEELSERQDSFSHPEAPAVLPRTFAAVDSWLDVLDALLSYELCELILEHLVPQHCGCRVSAGLFGVPKKGSSKTRLIIDRRSQNSREVGLRTALAGLRVLGLISLERLQELTRLCTLPYPAQFCRLLLGATSTWSVCSEDVADYYYLMRLPWACEVTNVLGPPVCASCACPPLVAARRKHMVYADSTPLSNVWQSVYIDDYCQLSLMDSRMTSPFTVEEVTKVESEVLGKARSCYADSATLG